MRTLLLRVVEALMKALLVVFFVSSASRLVLFKQVVDGTDCTCDAPFSSDVQCTRGPGGGASNYLAFGTSMDYMWKARA